MEINSWGYRQWLVFGIVFVAVVLLVWFVGLSPKQAVGPATQTTAPAGETQVSATSHQFLGEVQSVGGSVVKVLGVHVLDSNSNQTNFNTKTTVSVTIDSSTKLEKTVWRMPAKKGGLMERIPQTGSVSDMQKDLTVTINTTKDTLNSQTFTAAEVLYNITAK